MNIKRIEYNGVPIAVIDSNDVIVTDVQSALDLMATVQYETDCNRLAISKGAFKDDFFILSTGIAGEILQKFVTYNFKLAIIGSFVHYTGKSLHNFIYESNKGSHVFFVETEEAAAKLLGFR